MRLLWRETYEMMTSVQALSRMYKIKMSSVYDIDKTHILNLQRLSGLAVDCMYFAYLNHCVSVCASTCL